MFTGGCADAGNDLPDLLLATRPRAEIIDMWLTDAKAKGLPAEEIERFRAICESWSVFIDIVFPDQPQAVTNRLLNELVDLNQPAPFFVHPILQWVRSQLGDEGVYERLTNFDSPLEP